MLHKIKYLLIFVPFLIVSCSFKGVKGNGNIVEDTRNVSEFSKIDVSGNYEVEINIGENTLVEIIAEENLLKLIKTKVKKHTLYISSRENLRPTEDLLIRISVENLSAIECSGVNDIIANNVDTEEFDIELSGAGSILINGKAERFFLEISGAADIEAKDFIVEDVVIEVSGAANAEVYASQSVDAEVSGAGFIELYGDAKRVRTDISGAGSLVRK
ncbi:MAG: head GIN domain-containing protein [Melioribacteraceae bacterium]